MSRVFLVGGLVLAAGALVFAEESPRPLVRAHAHNDYLHQRPLLDALAHGFCSVEADIFLVGQELLVAHDVTALRRGRTLEALYLTPLRQRVAANKGRVYPEIPTFILLIDIKSEGESTYGELRKVLTRYADLLTSVVDGKTTPGAVQVVVSGNRPQATMAAHKIRHAGIDGRLSDLGTSKPSHLMPLISDRWTSHFRWRGNGPMPDDERAKLNDIVQQAHQSGQRVRFWATPESEAVWKELVRADVDLINTDDLPRLQRFLLP